MKTLIILLFASTVFSLKSYAEQDSITAITLSNSVQITSSQIEISNTIDQTKTDSPGDTIQKVVKKKNKFLAIGLSIIPGVGHYYVGTWKKGLAFTAGRSLLYVGVMASLSNPVGLSLLSICSLGVTFWDIYDAHRDVIKHNKASNITN